MDQHIHSNHSVFRFQWVTLAHDDHLGPDWVAFVQSRRVRFFKNLIVFKVPMISNWCECGLLLWLQWNPKPKLERKKIADKCRSQLMEIYKEIESESLNVVNIYLKLFVRKSFELNNFLAGNPNHIWKISTKNWGRGNLDKSAFGAWQRDFSDLKARHSKKLLK